MQVLQVALEKAQRQAASAARGPPNQEKPQRIFIGRAKKRLLQHDVVINEAQEALQKAESMKRADVERLAEAGSRGPSKIPPFRHRFGTIGGTVAVGARWFGGSIEEPKIHEIGGYGPPFAEFRRSRSTCVGTIRQTASSGRRHTYKTSRISPWLDGLQAIGVTRCSRDGRHRPLSRSCPSCSPRELSG